VSLLTEARRRAYGESVTQPWFADAVRLRRWDDAAKVAGAAVPLLTALAALLERYFGPQPWPPTGAA
jgi:predicted HD phosphohydrolase